MNKIERPKAIQIIDRIQPKDIQSLTRKIDVEFNKIYDFLDKLVDYINKKEGGGE